MGQKYTTLIAETVDGIATITINRPTSLNAISLDVVTELEQVMKDIRGRVAEDPRTVLGVILTGSGGRAFVAGADITEMSEMTAEEGEVFGRRMQEVTLQLEHLPVPVIAAVDGFALGGGCELALACDFIYATSNAMFGQPEVKLGLIPGFGGTVRLQQRIGIGRARELIYTGKMLTAEQAYHQGLVNALYPTRQDVLNAAQETLQMIAHNSPTAVAISKRAINQARGLSTVDGLEQEAAAFKEVFTTADMRAGTQAFLAKEKPRFGQPFQATSSKEGP